MDIKEILSKCDHTLLKHEATLQDIYNLCDEAYKYQTATVCVAPCFVKDVKKYVENQVKVCTVVGFPNGYNTTAVKVFETENAIKNGADEIDMVINIGKLKDKDYDYLLNEIKQIKKACGEHILKVIIETCLLTDEEKIKMCEICYNAGADYIKTSTGLLKGGATLHDVELMRKHSHPDLKVKAAGGITGVKDAEEFIKLGADRIGTSRVVKEYIAKTNGGAIDGNTTY